MIAPHEAFELVQRRVRALGTESRPLAGALGHYLAEEVRADRDLPPADRSAMDGYAVRKVAAGSPVEFRPWRPLP